MKNSTSLEDQDQDDHQLEQLPARHPGLFHGEPVDIVQRLQLLLHIGFHCSMREPSA